MKRNDLTHKLFPLSLCLAALLSGCAQTETTQMTPTTETPKEVKEYTPDDFTNERANPVSVSYQTITENRPDETDATIYSSLEFPVVSINGNEEVSNVINDTLSLYEDSYRENLKKYCDEAAKKRLENPHTFDSYSYISNFHMQRGDERILSFTHSEYILGDAENPQQITTTVNFDTKTGALLTLSDLSDDTKRFLTVLKQEIINQCNSTYYLDSFTQKPNSKAFANAVDGILTDDYWYIDHCGVNIVANDFSLGSMMDGNLIFTVPFAHLDGILKEDYVSDNGFVYPVVYDSMAMNYLNDDEALDAICLTSSITDESGMRTPFIAINGVDYTDAIKKAGISEFYGLTPYYYLLDLDESDRFVEFAICDAGLDDINQTYIFRYTGNSVIYLGSITDLPSHTAEFYGDKTMRSIMRLNAIEMKNAFVTYALKDDAIEMVTPEWYYPEDSLTSDIYSLHNVLNQFTVYTDKDTSSEAYTLKRADGPIKILATDNKEWSVIETVEGKVYFVHLNDGLNIDSDGESIPSTDLLDNLLIGG